MEEDGGEAEVHRPPALQYLHISWVRDILEEARVGISVIHQVHADNLTILQVEVNAV